MSTGLVLGKFYPLHLGHIGLIEFAEIRCNTLFVLICASDKEAIPSSIRLQWLQETFSNHDKIKVTLLEYFEKELPNTSISSKDVSKIWAKKILDLLPKIDVVFSSENYGNYLAEFLKCKHIIFEPTRTTNNISASEIRQNTFRHWDYIASSAKPYFIKKVCIYGTESTGKSTLTKKLAAHYETNFVPEMARKIIEGTDECTERHLLQIAELQAKTIKQKLVKANRVLFIDTDLNITRSYSKYLFGVELIVPKWVEAANQFDLYLYLEIDSPYIQDGTRLDKTRRDELNSYHSKELNDRKIRFELITGNWEERFEKSVSILDEFLR